MVRALLPFLLAGVVGALVASYKGRSPVAWFVISFLLPPAVVVLMLLPRGRPSRGARRCPHCAGMMGHEDAACPHCGRAVPVSIEMVKCPSCGVMVREAGRCEQCGKEL